MDKTIREGIGWIIWSNLICTALVLFAFEKSIAGWGALLIGNLVLINMTRNNNWRT